MGLQRHIKKTLLTLSKVVENHRSNVPANARSVISSVTSHGFTASNQKSQINIGPQLVANSSFLYPASQIRMQSQNLVSKSHNHLVKLTQFVFKCQRWNSLFPLLSCSSYGNSSKNGNSLTCCGQSEKETKLHIACSTPSRPAHSTTNKASVFQSFSLQTSLRSGCSYPTITHRALFQHHPNRSMVCRLKHTKPQVPPTKIARVYDYEGAITDEQAAEEFVFALKTSERQHLYAELAKYQGVNSNGTQTSPPTRKQLQQVVLHQTFPFLGFGFLDNLLMIVAGEYIDVTLGAAFGISTMAAAALGNLISDVGGLGSAHYVETLAARVGVRNPHLSPEQVEMRRTKWASNLGKFIGVTVGCLLGMFPLLFFNDKKCEEKEEEESPKAADEKGEKLTKKESEARPV